MAQSDATKLALAFLVVSTMALFAGLALYFDPHMRADGFNGVDANTEGLLQVTQTSLSLLSSLSVVISSHHTFFRRIRCKLDPHQRSLKT